MIDYNPNRIVLMRRLEKMPQAKLSEKTGYSSALLSKLQNSIIPFDEKKAQRIASAVDYPISFFARSDEPMPPTRLTYRRTSKTSIREINAVSAEYEILSSTVQQVTRKTNIKPHLSWLDEIAPHRSTVLTVKEINRIAVQAREHLHIPYDEPIVNVTRALERSGIVITPMHSSGEKADSTTSEGVTCPDYTGSTPVLGYLNRENTGDRLRFTKAHEFGHLVLHRFRKGLDKKQKEKEAHQFAGAFLMPEKAMRTAINKDSTLSSFVNLKAGWGVSIAALIMRASALNIIDAQRERSLQIQLSMRGWKKCEPVEVEVEHPLLFKQMMGKAFGKIISPAEIEINSLTASYELGVPFRFLDLWADGLSEGMREIGIRENRFSNPESTST